jgi:flavodoxin
MKNAIIYYDSRKGTTKYFAEEVGDYLKSKGIENKVYSVFDAKSEQTADADFILLGCWTHGIFITLQHPPKAWSDFAKELPSLKGRKIALFATYKLATGSLFRKMEKALRGKIDSVSLTFKSKNDKLDQANRALLDKFFA